MNAPEKVSASCVHMLADAAAANPGGEALVFIGGPRLTWSEFESSVADCAGRFGALGARGQRVAVALPNSADLVIAFLAALASGAQAVLLNPDYSERELFTVLEDAQPVLVVCTSALAPVIEGIAARTETTFRVVVLGGSDAIRRPAPGRELPLPLPLPEELSLLQYTGGTTGRPKGVILSHRTLALNIAQRDALLPMRPGVERLLCMTPLFHMYALAMAFFPALCSAGTMVVLPRYRPDDALAAIAAERITLFAGAPTIYNGLVAHPSFEGTDFSSLVGAFSGAAPLSVEVLATWEAKTRAPIYEGYGLTEATGVLTFNPMAGPRKRGSVGIPLPGTEIEVVDVETGAGGLSPGTLGEVRARGPQMMLGYRNLPAETAAILRDGWLHTGDIGELDDDGYLFLRNRKSDLVIVGGYNVYPREIEEVLFAHPAVQEAAAAGLPDTYRGEVIEAAVALKPGASASGDELIAHCARELVRYKVPVRIHLVAELPKTAAGKLDRKSVRALLLDAMTQ